MIRRSKPITRKQRGIVVPIRRKRIKPRSEKTIAAAEEHRDVRMEVFTRDGHACVLRGRVGPCAGALTYGHLRKASQGGKYTPENGITLCVRCNEWCETAPREAHSLGLVIRNGERSVDAWATMQRCGLVSYGPNGERIDR